MSTDDDPKFINIAAYRFVELDRLKSRRAALRKLCAASGLKGTILLSVEGVNVFVSGARPGIERLLAELRSWPGFADLEVKESLSDRHTFRRMLVKIKREIIAFGRPTATGEAPRLAPRELRRWLDEGRPVRLLDTRNRFEVELGTFRGAVDPDLENFRDFPEALESIRSELQGGPIVTFCTGGIRCEKAAPYMKSLGYEDVWQLDGGILKYFEECGGAHFDGECFVFDQRVALDPELQETSTVQCFACQAPLTPDEQASSLYREGEHCPRCYVDEKTRSAQRLEKRNVALAQLLEVLPGSIPADNERPIHVSGRYHGWTLIEMLTNLHPHVDDWGRRIEEGLLVRRGRPLGPATLVASGDRVLHVERAVIEPPVSRDVQVVFDDGDVVAINKPAPLPMHPCGRFNRNSLSSFLASVYRPKKLRPAHRLDANTSGIVLFTTSRRLAGLLQAQFEERSVEKLYLLEVVGAPNDECFTCDAPIARDVGVAGRRRVSVNGDPAQTRFRVVERRGSTTLLEAKPLSGRTNQIRIHAQALGLPIVADAPYQDRDATMTISTDAPPMHLHAQCVTFDHPVSGERITLSAVRPSWAQQTPALVGQNPARQ